MTEQELLKRIDHLAGEIAEAFAALENDTQRVAKAFELFGYNGHLIPARLQRRLKRPSKVHLPICLPTSRG